MAKRDLKHVTIIGVGLIGGSAGLALKAHDPDIHIAGVGRRQSSLDEAMAVGAIDAVHFDSARAVAGSDLIILATPVGAFGTHLKAIKPHLKKSAVVTDVGSTKSTVVRLSREILGPGEAFVGSHPMAGSERKGVSFARADLFAGATCVITPTRNTPTRITSRVEKFWSTLGMHTVRMSPAAHDRVMARVSHLPHVLAALLMMLPHKKDLDVSATGFADATRLAGGDPEMWRDILMTNRQSMLKAIDDFDESLIHLRDLLDRGDAPGVKKFLASAKKRRDATLARRMQERRVSAE